MADNTPERVRELPRAGYEKQKDNSPIDSLTSIDKYNFYNNYLK